ncbi:MAG: YebC/PmpR family DNA-binding transcriptional regulator [Oscillospiraceae bacterium]|jgi:YebC/PmpR family DNA-binding regulatory protein|nr:YebC/PmpR family DNA-binding transcriptional regulator [Oscillospiraceae bacterium]
MSGHSKWSNIKRKKEKTDSQRAKIFTKIGRELSVAVKEGGSDPASNSKLKDCIAKAKSNNVPNDNIERIIKKAVGESGTNKYETITYEGYGAGGVAFMVETLTDNKNRTASNIRYYFDKYCGNLGTTGCVSFMFSPKGIIIVKNENFTEEKIMEDAINFGATDFNFEDDESVIITQRETLYDVYQKLIDSEYKCISAQIEMIPGNYTQISDEGIKAKIETLIEVLEEDDDVQNIWHNLQEE